VKFWGRFNQRIELPAGLKTVVFGEDFDQPVVLPEGIENVSFYNDSYRHYVEVPLSVKDYYNSNRVPRPKPKPTLQRAPAMLIIDP
jgi:hypothetical protein